MRPLVIGPAETAALQEVKTFAREHPFTLDDLQKINERATQNLTGHLLADGHYTTIPLGFESVRRIRAARAGANVARFGQTFGRATRPNREP